MRVATLIALALTVALTTFTVCCEGKSRGMALPEDEEDFRYDDSKLYSASLFPYLITLSIFFYFCISWCLSTYAKNLFQFALALCSNFLQTFMC